MANPFDEVRSAVQLARANLQAVEQQSNAMAGLLAGNLRFVSGYHLKQLKKELRNFDMTTGRWK